MEMDSQGSPPKGRRNRHLSLGSKRKFLSSWQPRAKLATIRCIGNVDVQKRKKKRDEMELPKGVKVRKAAPKMTEVGRAGCRQDSVVPNSFQSIKRPKAHSHAHLTLLEAPKFGQWRQQRWKYGNKWAG
jgi:hypothetical protein